MNIFCISISQLTYNIPIDLSSEELLDDSNEKYDILFV